MSTDGDLYGEDIHLWSERQSALLRRLAAGEAVTNQIDWPHVVEEIEDVGHTQGRHPSDQDEIARLTAMLKAAEARVNELRSRLDELTGKLADARAELATAQDQADTAAARATAAIEAERAMREADMKRRTRGRWTRLVAAWRGE